MRGAWHPCKVEAIVDTAAQELAKFKDRLNITMIRCPTRVLVPRNQS